VERSGRVLHLHSPTSAAQLCCDVAALIGVSVVRSGRKRGEGELVEVKCPTASEAEIQREWKIAVSRGPEAMLKFLGLDKRFDALESVNRLRCFPVSHPRIEAR
jgi:hypothetical protein